LDDFIVLINGCTIYEIVIDEIEAVMFKAKGCPVKSPNRTLSVVEKAGQEPVPENNETSPRDLPVEEPAVTPPRVRTKRVQKNLKRNKRPYRGPTPLSPASSTRSRNIPS